MFKTYWQKGYQAFEKGMNLATMFAKHKVEAGSSAAYDLSAGFKAAKRVAGVTANGPN